MALVDLIIRLKDNASQGIGGITASLRGLSGRAGEAAKQTGGLANTIAEGVLKAQALTFALGKAQEAIGFLNGKFEEAKNLQLEQINAATTFAALTGQSSDQAARFIESLNDRLAKSAATLPGATQDYKALAIAVQDNVLEAFKDPSGTLNQKGFEDTLASMSESFGALTAASTRDIGNTSLGLSKALGGASIAELRSIAFFEQNPVILNEIEKRLAAAGKQMQDLNIRERVQLLQEVGQKFITEDFKQAASESVDGLLQSFQSTLFDPSAGILGIMRDLDPQTEGVQSAFKSMNDALIEVIGPSGVFFTAADILHTAGIEFGDPMAALKGSVDFAVEGLRRINTALFYMKDFIQAGGSLTDALRIATSQLLPTSALNPQAISDTLTNFFVNTGDRIKGTFDQLVSMAAPLFNQGVGIISEYFSDPQKFHDIGIAFGGMLGRVGSAAIAFLARIDYPQLLVGIGRVAISILAGIAGAIGGLSLGLMPGIGELLANSGLWILGAVETFGYGFSQNFVDMIPGLLGFIGASLRVAGATISGIFGVLVAGISTYANAVQGLLTGGVSGFFQSLIDSFKGIIEAGQQLISGVMAQLRNIPGVGQLIPAPTPAPATAPVGARYSGHIGWAAGGFLGDLIGAAQQEIGRMPGGANLLVANSSETILPQGMLGNLLRSLVQPAAIALPTPQAAPMTAPAVGGSGGNTINLTVNIDGASGDPRAIAEEVIGQLQGLFDAELNGQLS